MAISKAKNATYMRKYYRTHSKYRQQKINDRKEYAKSHRKKEAEYSKEYYHSNPSYRRYKIAYARAYRKAHKR